MFRVAPDSGRCMRHSFDSLQGSFDLSAALSAFHRGKQPKLLEISSSSPIRHTHVTHAGAALFSSLHAAALFLIRENTCKINTVKFVITLRESEDN